MSVVKHSGITLDCHTIRQDITRYRICLAHFALRIRKSPRNCTPRPCWKATLNLCTGKQISVRCVIGKTIKREISGDTFSPSIWTTSSLGAGHVGRSLENSPMPGFTINRCIWRTPAESWTVSTLKWTAVSSKIKSTPIPTTRQMLKWKNWLKVKGSGQNQFKVDTWHHTDVRHSVRA